MERIDDIIYSTESLHSVKDKISLWNGELLKGIGFYRGHDKYAYLEISVYEYGSYPNKNKLDRFSGSFIDWKIDKEVFPFHISQNNKKELFNYARAIVAIFSNLIGRHVDLIFEITFAGHHPTDNWGKGACGRAFINAIVSCFDENLFKQGLGHRTNLYNQERLAEIRKRTTLENETNPFETEGNT
ncbi:MAG: hypothetical protein ACO1N9_09210 [Flavobacterium sp.]